MAQKFKIKKGDQVIVTTGKDKGRRGEVIQVIRAESRVLVQGCNMCSATHVQRRQTLAASLPRKHHCIFRMLPILTRIAALQRASAMRSRTAKRSGSRVRPARPWINQGRETKLR